MSTGATDERIGGLLLHSHEELPNGAVAVIVGCSAVETFEHTKTHRAVLKSPEGFHQFDATVTLHFQRADLVERFQPGRRYRVTIEPLDD